MASDIRLPTSPPCPSPVLSAVEGLDLPLADLASELEGCETCLAAMAEDARRLAGLG